MDGFALRFRVVCVVVTAQRMGQQIGKASFEEDAKPFLNLPAPAINAVWTAFNLAAESWGLRASSFVNICRPLAPFLSFDDPTMQIKAHSLFTLLDTDINGVVDALEFMCCLAMVSAMEPADKIKFVYTVYDFSEKGCLLVDEITLAIKSTVEGLCKISKLPSPGVAACEALARLAFAANGKAAVVASGGTLSLAEFIAYTDANPTAASWMSYFDDIPDSAGEAPAPSLAYTAPSYPTRSVVEASFMAGRGPPAAPALKPVPEWYRAPVIDDSFIPGEGEDPSDETVRYLDPGTPCFAAVQQLLKPEEPRRTIATPPDSQLVLDWVHGVSTMARGHVKYSGKDGSVVYPVGSVAVQYRFPNEEEEVSAFLFVNWFVCPHVLVCLLVSLVSSLSWRAGQLVAFGCLFSSFTPLPPPPPGFSHHVSRRRCSASSRTTLTPSPRLPLRPSLAPTATW
jgi:Ca2+-binding EF-hand superfamily protein